MYAVILLLLISYARAQQDMCSCSCCVGQFCNPTNLGMYSVPFCTYDSCRTFCRDRFLQCRSDYPNGQVFPQCTSATTTYSPLYNCRCDCCRTGSPTCIPSFVGYSTAYTCQPGACSISCATQYPNQCVSDPTGQTDGTCIGAITTTTTTTSTTTISTTRGSSSGTICSCRCCQSGPSCSPNIEVGYATGVTQCSSATCTTACQNQYSVSCPSISYLGYTNGVCLVSTNGNTRYQCQVSGFIVFLLTILIHMPVLNNVH